MKWLAIDTSCDESCAAIVDSSQKRLLSDVVHSHVARMKDYGGVVPEIASREHLKGLPLAVHHALSQAGLTPGELDAIAVTNRPGLIGALLVGVAYAKAMAFALGKPLLTLDHVEAHLYSPLLAQFEESQVPPFPWIALVVSGGHTELFEVRGPLDHQWLGGTLDDAAGEAFDKVGKLLELPYPAGPTLDRWVREKATESDMKQFAFPIARTKQPLDFSFSGLKTAVALQVQKLKADKNWNDQTRLAVAASAQEAIVEQLVRRLRKAANLSAIDNIVVTGGVACNSRLRAKLPEAHFPKPKHCTDNAAMVAVLAQIYEFQDKVSPASLHASAAPVSTSLISKAGP